MDAGLAGWMVDGERAGDLLAGADAQDIYDFSTTPNPSPPAKLLKFLSYRDTWTHTQIQRETLLSRTSGRRLGEYGCEKRDSMHCYQHHGIRTLVMSSHWSYFLLPFYPAMAKKYCVT